MKTAAKLKAANPKAARSKAAKPTAIKRKSKPKSKAIKHKSKPKPKSSLMSQVARSVDAPDPLIPVLSRLFDGLDGLGCMPVVTARLLQTAGVGPRSRVIDVGCGKGAVAVALARRTGCRVLGIDACEAFIEAARSLATRLGVADRCEFIAGDLHRLSQSLPASSDVRTSRRRGATPTFDAALMMGVRPLHEAAPILRRLVRPGGVYAIDDVFHVPGRRLPAGVTAQTRADARARLERDGDAVLREHVPALREVAALNRSLYWRIAANARNIGRDAPALRRALREFLLRQREANRQLTGPLRPAIWIVRRGPNRARRDS